MADKKLGELLKYNIKKVQNVFEQKVKTIKVPEVIRKLKISDLKNYTLKLSRLNVKFIDKYRSLKIVNKKRFAINISIVSTILLIIIYLGFANSAYSIIINGKEIGKARDKKSIEAAIETIKQQFVSESSSEVNLSSDITIKRVRARRNELLEGAALLEAIKSNIQYKVKAFSIYSNGNLIATLKDKAAAENVLQAVKSYYISGIDQKNLKEVAFSENIEIKAEFTDIGSVMAEKEAQDFVLKGTDEVKTHKVESGESFWTIARKYNISMENLQKANPGANPEKIKIGQEINLIVPKPLINVKTVENVTYIDKIPFEQKLEFSSSMYKDETKVKTKGEYGEKEVIANVVKVNGIETGRSVLSEKVIKSPKTQVILKGTKTPPPKKGTGTFAMPTRGSLTSRFGSRWGRQHTGIDLAAPIGTPVKASDGGVVVYVGYEGGYGKLIKIDHGAGFISYYGHLSKYYVQKGDKVYKGQKIGAVGNTGRSTGPHLHFEIRKNGVPQNPYKYLK